MRHFMLDMGWLLFRSIMTALIISALLMWRIRQRCPKCFHPTWMHRFDHCSLCGWDCHLKKT